MSDLPDWLRKLPPLSDGEIRNGVDAARRYLERSTPDLAVEQQRLVVELADRLANADSELCRLTHHKRGDGCSIPDCAHYRSRER